MINYRSRLGDGVPVALCIYDALGRRIRKTITAGGLSSNIADGTTDYLYAGAQCLEERDPFHYTGGGEGSSSSSDDDQPMRQYIWGRYIDELIQQKHVIAINGHAAGDYYPLCDLLYRTMALTNSSGTIVEAYDTDAYGNTLVFSAQGTGSN